MFYLVATMIWPQGVAAAFSFSELCSLHVLRVVYMLQSCPMEDAVRLLNPILSAQTWVSFTLQWVKTWTTCPGKVADVWVPCL